MIVWARIDNRLIHGQVATSFAKATGATIIAIIDDKVAASAVERALLEAIAPAGMKVVIATVERGAELLRPEGKLANYPVFLMTKTPVEMLALVERGVEIPVINVGNMPQTGGKRPIAPSVAVDDEDVRIFRALYQKGVRFDVRRVVDEKPRDLVKLLQLDQPA